MQFKEKPLGRVILLHGIETPSKAPSIRRFAVSFREQGFCVIIPYYGFFPALFAGLIKWFDRRLADTLSAFIQPEDILVGYSNGATLVYMITKRVPVRAAVLVNAALKPTLTPRAGFTHIYYNGGDWATRLAQLIPFHLWGDMGYRGYIGDENNVTSVDCGHPPEGLPPLDGHADVFTRGHVRPWGRYMAQRLQEALPPTTK